MKQNTDFYEKIKILKYFKIYCKENNLLPTIDTFITRYPVEQIYNKHIDKILLELRLLYASKNRIADWNHYIYFKKRMNVNGDKIRIYEKKDLKILIKFLDIFKNGNVNFVITEKGFNSCKKTTLNKKVIE